ncbi:hypothetical protein FHX44_118164 [Pseudonocardia hierapolitana]|uniref:Uncharacterized protein n=1 Tax=Pseudonocardia hierapolitana TaxID=1128676 RepID=A0A561T545_9PSEU|nr:hypothetical protein FHX44_118164 [Pseudonocardia hierapolitana]
MPAQARNAITAWTPPGRWPTTRLSCATSCSRSHPAMGSHLAAHRVLPAPVPCRRDPVTELDDAGRGVRPGSRGCSSATRSTPAAARPVASAAAVAATRTSWLRAAHPMSTRGRREPHVTPPAPAGCPPTASRRRCPRWRCSICSAVPVETQRRCRGRSARARRWEARRARRGDGTSSGCSAPYTGTAGRIENAQVAIYLARRLPLQARVDRPRAPDHEVRREGESDRQDAWRTSPGARPVGSRRAAPASLLWPRRPCGTRFGRWVALRVPDRQGR